MRLNIDYKDLDDLLEKYQDALPSDEKLTRVDVKIFKSIFFGLAEISNGGWISVEDKDRLPENKIVLVSVVTKNTGHRWETPLIGEIVHGEWFLETAGTIADNVGVTVTHWMPRPIPPKEKKT